MVRRYVFVAHAEVCPPPNQSCHGAPGVQVQFVVDSIGKHARDLEEGLSLWDWNSLLTCVQLYFMRHTS